jgi:hypothetical protein
MRLADRERRRLDAVAFDLLESEDGFRLQLLLEFRNRAARARRLLIDELVTAHLITRKRYQALAQTLGIDQSISESLVIDHTLGEESYEDSVVDVAPVPRSLSAPISASIAERRTLVQGSKTDKQRSHLISSDGALRSKLDDDHPSEGELSSLTMHSNPPNEFNRTALLGAPARQRLTEPDARDPELTPTLKDRAPNNQLCLFILAQIERLLQTNADDDSRMVRLSIAAQSFARLSFEFNAEFTTPELAKRMERVCVSIISELEPEQALLWLNAFMIGTLNQYKSPIQTLNLHKIGGTLVVHGDTQLTSWTLDRVTVREGWITRTSQSIDQPSEAGDDSKFTSVRHVFELPAGWYELNWRSDNRDHVAQTYVLEATETAIVIPNASPAPDQFVHIAKSLALLGADSDSQNHLAFNLYNVPSYELSPSPVSFREYFVFLKFLKQTQGPQAAIRRSPRGAARGEFRWSELDFADSNACEERLGDLYDNALTGVSFHDARAYCHWLNIEQGPGHRLPSEMEWEKALRGCLGTRWSWGDIWSANLSKNPSSFGIMLDKNMRLEWTSSSGLDARYRIARGVGLENDSARDGLAERLFLPEEQVNQYVGFRVARTST